uniref:Myomesin 3 n=1 Tax=Podarcis muralis TaxID=64176 RepID=A0A670IQL3_PODMU
LTVFREKAKAKPQVSGEEPLAYRLRSSRSSHLAHEAVLAKPHAPGFRAQRYANPDNQLIVRVYRALCKNESPVVIVRSSEWSHLPFKTWPVGEWGEIRIQSTGRIQFHIPTVGKFCTVPSLKLYHAFKDQKIKLGSHCGLWANLTYRKPSKHGFFLSLDTEAETAGAPGSPLSVQCHDVNRNSLILSWITPSDNGGSPVIGYYIERCEAGTDEWVLCNDKLVKACRSPVLGLTEGKTYQFRVKAVNRAGISNPSKASDPVTMIDPNDSKRVLSMTITVSKDELEPKIKVPLPPTNVHASEIREEYAVLSWDEPDPRGKEPLSYYVEKSIAGSDSWQMANLDTPVNSTTFTVFDLDKEKTYCFRVRSVNKYGVSEPSLPSEPISSGEKIVPLPPPSQVLTFRDTNTSVFLKWSKPKEGQEPLGYYIYCREVGTDEWQTVNNKPVTCNEFTVPGLKTGKEYVFCVKCVNEAGVGDSSPESDAIIVRQAISCPSAPRAFALLSCGKDNMTIAWKPPKRKGGTTILGYFLDQHDVSQIEWHEINIKPIVTSLDEGHFYEFRGYAMNVAGVGKVSEPSDIFKCEEWTMPEPGPPYDVRCTEVRDTSLMLHWEPPVYTGAGPVTGYYVDACEEGSDTWEQLNKQPISSTHMKLSDLETGKCYIFRVRALNKAGVGPPSLPSDPVVVRTKPGTKEIEVGVDEEGFIYMAFEAPEMVDTSEFIWSKDYEGPPNPDRVEVVNKDDKSKLILKYATERDLGTYSVEVTDTDEDISLHSSSSDSNNLSHLLLFLSVIDLISGWNIDVLEKGEVRLWLEVEKLSPEAELHLIFNGKELSSTPTHKINFDKAKGLVELIIQDFSEDDKGTYTAKLKDGKAENQFTLALVGDDFDKLKAEADAKKREWKRKHGPHFIEQLQWKVTEDCEVLLTCKVNKNKQMWVKRKAKNRRLDHLSQLNFHPHNPSLPIILCLVLSASPLKVQPTVEGIKIYSEVKYYTDAMKATWDHNDKRVEAGDRLKTGTTMEQVWLHILDPKESDKGKYTLELFDGEKSRKLDLSYLYCFSFVKPEFLFLMLCLLACLFVCLLFVKQTLCLTCIISGDPYPEITWYKNEQVITFKDRYKMEVKGTVITITIENVSSEDSGKFSIFVKNKWGSETGKVTVSVYKHGEEPKELRDEQALI